MQLRLIHSLAFLLVLLLAALPARANPDGIAVIVGNRDYGEGIPDVRFAHNDAAAMKRFVVDVLGYREGNVILLENASQAELFATFGNATNPRGKLWGWAKPRLSDVTVYYSGHGVPGQSGGRGYLLPVDADPDTPEINGYPLDLLYRNLAAIGARSVTVYLEACFTGDSAGGSLCRNCSGLQVEQRRSELPPGLTVISAAAADQVASWDEEAQLGLFTHYLLRGLYGEADENSDNRVEVREVRHWLDTEMSYAARLHYRRIQTASARGLETTELVRLNPPIPRFDNRNSPETETRDMWVMASGVVNIRAGPGTQHTKVGQLMGGDRVVVLGHVPDQPWFRISLLDGRTGYVHESLLSLQAPAVEKSSDQAPPTAGPVLPTHILVDKIYGNIRNPRSSTYVYTAPDVASRIIRQAPANTRIIVSGKVRGADWYRVYETEEQSGYIPIDPDLIPDRSLHVGPANHASLEGYESFRDCPICPEMVAVRATDLKRALSAVIEMSGEAKSGPRDPVLVDLAIGRLEISIADYLWYLDSRDLDAASMESGCYYRTELSRELDPNGSFLQPGYPSNVFYPAVCISWNDAQSYIDWLRETTGKAYRLLSLPEWRLASIAGILFMPRPSKAEEARDASCQTSNFFHNGVPDCADTFEFAAPVGRLAPNALGLQDMDGNVGEWVNGCVDVAARFAINECKEVIYIGGDWSMEAESVDVIQPFLASPSARLNFVGFRVARPLGD